MNKSVHVLHFGNSVQEIINMVMVAALDAQCVQNRELNKCKDDFKEIFR